jgi:hypothetical protein
MRTEIKLLGKHFSMARRTARRRLVVAVYVAIGVLILGAWFLAQRWPGLFTPYAFLILIFITVSLRSHTLDALIKPFNGNETLSSFGMHPETQDKRYPIPSILKSKYLNDEWDLRRRNEAHWRAYRWIYPMIALPWFIAAMKFTAAGMSKDYWFSRYASSYSYDLLLYSLLTALVCVYATLPQAILLWTEPDMEQPQ